MKKLFFLGALFAVGLGFTACSSDKDVVAEGTNPNENGGENYIAIGINLPTADMGFTRAGEDKDNNENVTYDDGEAYEYTVNDAMLLIFGTGPDPLFKGAYGLSTAPWKNTDGTEYNVTEYSTKVVQKVGSTISADDQLLVILNSNSLINIDSETSITIGSTNIGTSSKFSDFMKATVASNTLNMVKGTGAMTANGFYMANAPLSNTQGSTTTPITGTPVRVLVPLTATYPTQAAAAAGNADQIYVERGMAKVTFDNTAATGDDAKMSASKLDGTGDLTWTVNGWILDNTNKTSYLVRNIENDATNSFLGLVSNAGTPANVYRYIGNTPITFPTTPTYKYRTYFAKDPNYTAAENSSATFNRYTAGTAFSTKFGSTNPQYCFENTFDVPSQNVNNTTLAQVAIQAVNGSAADLYTLGANKTTVYTLSSLTTAIQTAAWNYLVAEDAFSGDKGTASSTQITVTLSTADRGALSITKLTPDAALKALIKPAYLNSDDFAASVVSATETAIGKTATAPAITKYKDGISYYNIRIKHFGDRLTPWNTTETVKPSLGTIYPESTTPGQQAKNYLGRYGVLRNNWYDLRVTKVRMLGDAEPKTGNWPETPDDELDNYISFQINVLSWAKHATQTAEL
jgi:hypothetical protein